MPRSLADGHIKLALLTQKPADPFHPTVAELNAGLDISCRVLSNGYKLGPTKSDTVDEKSLCQTGKAEALTTSNYEASVTVFRYFDLATGKPETAAAGTPGEIGDGAYQALKTKGSEVYLYQRFTSKTSLEPWAEGDEVAGYLVTTDNPVPGEATGYIKYEIQMSVQDAWLDGTVGAAAAVAPTLASIAPATGGIAGGTTVTLTSTGFVAGMTVSFGGTAATAVNVTSATSATATSPAHAAGAVQVTATTTGGTTAGKTYTYA